MANITLQEQQAIVDALWMNPDFLAELRALNDWQQAHLLEAFRRFAPPEEFPTKWEGDQFIGNFYADDDERESEARGLLFALKGNSRQWMFKRFEKLLDAVCKVVPQVIVVQGIDNASRYGRLDPPKVSSTLNQAAWAIEGHIDQLPNRANDHEVKVSGTAPVPLEVLPLSMLVFWRDDTAPGEILGQVKFALARMAYEPIQAKHRWPPGPRTDLLRTIVCFNVWQEWLRLRQQSRINHINNKKDQRNFLSNNNFYKDYLSATHAQSKRRDTASESIVAALDLCDPKRVLIGLKKTSSIQSKLADAKKLCGPSDVEVCMSHFLSCAYTHNSS